MYSSDVAWGHFEATGSNASNNNNCDAPVSINVPFVQEGVGDFCFTTTDIIGNINSWSLNSLVINGVDYTNTYEANISPNADGEYLIEYSSSVAWGHFEANLPTGTNSAQYNDSSSEEDELEDLSEFEGIDSNNRVATSFKVYPISAREEIFLQMNDFLGKEVNITLINQLGQVMYMVEYDQLDDSIINIPLDEFGNGLYYVRLIIDQKESMNKSFIVQQ